MEDKAKSYQTKVKCTLDKKIRKDRSPKTGGKFCKLEYEQHYKSILKIKEAKMEEEREVEKLVAHKFQEIKELEDISERKQIRTEVVRNAIKQTKSNKAADCYLWKAEWVKKAGEEMEKSLETLFNRVEIQGVAPDRWNKTVIKFVHKKGPKKDLSNQRGIFLTNIVS